jgi:hypothetical protein
LRSSGWIHALLGLSWLAVASWAARVLAPDTGNAGTLHSDSGVSLLMANAERLTPFHFYFFAQDRFGGWPFISAWLVHAVSGVSWSLMSFYGYLCVVFFAGAWAAFRLGGRWGWTTAAAYLGGATLLPGARTFIFDACQVHAWQIAPLMGAWWCLRRWRESEAAEARRWWVAGTVQLFLSSWISPSSLVYGLIITLVEVVPEVRRWSWRRWPLVPLPTALSWGLVTLVLVSYRGYSRSRHYWFQPTAMRVDYGQLSIDFRSVAAAFYDGGHLAVLILAGIGLALGLAVLLGVIARPSATNLARLIVGSVTIAEACFFIHAIISWTRLNGYAPRYLATAHVFATFAAILVVPLLSEWIGSSWRGLDALVALLVLMAIGWRLPKMEHDANYSRILEVAQQLESRAPGEVLMGEYWGLYVLAAVEQQHPLVPISYDGWERTPWNKEALRKADTVIVSHMAAAHLGAAEHPSPFLAREDTLLRLEEPGWLKVDGESFSRYRNITSRSSEQMDALVNGDRKLNLPIHTGMALPLSLSAPVPLSLSFAPRNSFRLLVAFIPDGENHQLDEVIWTLRDHDGQALTKQISVQRWNTLVSIEVAPDDGPLVERVELTTSKPISLSNAFLLPDEPLPPE